MGMQCPVLEPELLTSSLAAGNQSSHELRSGQRGHGAALWWQSHGGTHCLGRTGHGQALLQHIAALPPGMEPLTVQNPLAADVMAVFLLYNLGLLSFFPIVLSQCCWSSLPHAAPSTGALLLARAGDCIGCLLTEMEINVIILHSNWQHVW